MTAELFKSVHITNFYHKNSGGISTSYNNLLAAATKRGRHVRLIVPGETEEVEEVSEFAKIYYIPAKHSPIVDRRYRVIMPWQYMRSGSLIRKILLDERPDMIEVTDKYTLSLIGPMIRKNYFRRLGRPMLVHFSCERMDDNVRTFIGAGRLGKWLSSTVIGLYHLPSYDFHLANSEYTAAEFYESVNGSAPAVSKLFRGPSRKFFRAPEVSIEERIHVCPRGVNLAKFNDANRSDEIRQEICKRAGVPDDAVLLFYAGRLSPEKNVGLLLDLMRVLAGDAKRDYRLLIAGDGPKAKWLGARTAKLVPGKIVQFGHLDKNELAKFYANADVFVHPNPREPFGIAPLEAMASGLPLVAPRSGGILSYANDGNSWLVEPTATAFASAINEVLENAESRDVKVAKALATVVENSSESSAERLLDTYDRLYRLFQAKRQAFTREVIDAHPNFVKLTYILLIAGMTYLLRALDLDIDPAGLFGFF